MMNINEFTTIGQDDFWQLADELQEQTVEHAAELFAFAETAKPDDLLSLLIQYRFFTIYYIPDLAILIARLPDGRLRSFLADILSDELGYGDPENAHPHLYDMFLKSIGVPEETLDKIAIQDNIALLDDMRHQLMDPEKSAAYGIGLRGMGGECVCQIYLSKFYEHIVKNPYIQQRHKDIDWKFWDLHIGEHDIEHRIKTRKLINEEIVQQDKDSLVDLGRGYYESMSSWQKFWDNIFTSAKKKDVVRSQVRRTAHFQVPDTAEI